MHLHSDVIKYIYDWSIYAKMLQLTISPTQSVIYENDDTSIEFDFKFNKSHEISICCPGWISLAEIAFMWMWRDLTDD